MLTYRELVLLGIMSVIAAFGVVVVGAAAADLIAFDFLTPPVKAVRVVYAR